MKKLFPSTANVLSIPRLCGKCFHSEFPAEPREPVIGTETCNFSLPPDRIEVKFTTKGCGHFSPKAEFFQETES